ncbi:hypothetical protein RhiirA5_418296 [Rhizophagus irregularis]|uniref:HAT C-terminal dimerisation domain-containing protein n=1 Tax=Rhizophagus irregularis TaxID=588596 RepID=A0A2N0PKI6_9GLOM|nr:hypothetical protein RhiirA5_418296 [Rhizophagus irregularis]
MKPHARNYIRILADLIREFKNLYQILDSIIDALNFDNLHAGDQRDRDRAKKLLELFKSLLDATIAMIKTQFIDPKELPLQESALSSYGIEELKLLCKHFGNQKHKSNGMPVQPLINSSEFNIILLVPLSNANVERVFSQHKLTKTRLRNRLNVETLDMHLTILLNAPDNIEEFNWDKAFNQWKNEHVQ